MRIVYLLTLSLLAVALVMSPAQAGTASQASPRLTPTFKACHVCDEGLPQPVVRAVMFWMAGCPHCEGIIQYVLPPLRAKYGGQFDLLMLQVVEAHDVDALYRVAESYNISKEQTGVPFLIIGDHVLIGSDQVREQLPVLIDDYLEQGGVGWPENAVLDGYRASALPTSAGPATPAGGVVRAILFTTLDCRDCAIQVRAALAPVLEKYGSRFEYQTVDIVNPADVEYLHRVAAAYGVPPEEVDSPLIIVGDDLLMGEQIATEFQDLVATHMALGGVDWPSIPARPGIATSSPTPFPAQTPPFQSAPEQPSGFLLAIVIMVLMAAAWAYSLVAMAIGRTFAIPEWGDWTIAILLIIGIGIAAYLSYVETQSVEAMCGPVGDCNAVQQSRYARLFGILPVGVLGLLGYFALFAAWLVRKFDRRLEKAAAIGFWGMAFFAVIFSLYLTYLEPFVIKAVCIWCLASAVILALLLVLGTPAALRQFAQTEDE
jgi:uncharacterized membrane protein/glutaredoxin